MIEDLHDRRLALGARGVLAAFNAADVLHAADVHVATRLADLAGESDADVLLAAALTVRAVRQGSTCLDLRTVAETEVDDGVELAWPDPTRWLAAVARSRLVATEVLRLDEDLVYLDRYWREEVQVRDDLVRRAGLTPPDTDDALVREGVERVFADRAEIAFADEQRAAAAGAVSRWTTVLTGGPGTGKTTTVAGLLALLAEQAGDRSPRIALCAPTGKAAARLQEAVLKQVADLPPEDRERLGELRATTLHRLLGWVPRSNTRFRHDRDNRLPHDVVVVDETSMVSLTMMARLLEAVRPQTRLVLVGDPDQLASVEAGAVLADLVDGLGEEESGIVARLRINHRNDAEIGLMAEALRRGDPADDVLAIMRAGGNVEWHDPDAAGVREEVESRVVGLAREMVDRAKAGDAAGALRALDRFRLLCAHREGPYGVGGWNRAVERRLVEAGAIPPYQEWYAGRPVLITANDPGQDVYNGDLGVTVVGEDGRLRVALPLASDPDLPRLFVPTRIPDVETAYAMTVHKAQGSQAEQVYVVLPTDDSRLLTHELLYTAVTRAEKRVVVVGSEASVRAAVVRRVRRASGLAQRLR